MNFEFSPEQRQFQAQVAKVMHTRAPMGAARAALQNGGAIDREAWAALADIGLLGATIPETYGGNGAGHFALCVAAEEVGGVLAPLPLASTVYLFAEALLIAGSDAQKSLWLPKVAAGTTIGTGVLFGDSLSVQRGLLTGVTGAVSDGLVADAAIVVAREGESWSLFLVDLADARLSRRALHCLDPSKPQAALRFDGVPAEPVGEPGRGRLLAERVLQSAAVLIAFEQIGGADRALTMARDFALERHAFGRPIGSFQAIKHKLADVFVANQLARSHAYYGAWALANDTTELSIAAAGARVAASAAFSHAAAENVQTHGGIGFTWESDCQLFYRRARFLASCLGSPMAWRERLAVEIESGAAKLM
jgi:alkylation response protein AidB-like acyl-CoA dehydrogenase